MNKIPKWWFKSGIKGFINAWFWSYANPIWNIRDKFKR